MLSAMCAHPARVLLLSETSTRAAAQQASRNPPLRSSYLVLGTGFVFAGPAFEGGPSGFAIVVGAELARPTL